MYSQFRPNYYQKPEEPLYNPKEFKDKAPITYINCLYQKEALQKESVVMRVEFELNKDIEKNTAAYCLILHDRLFSYNPLTKIVKQL